MPSIRALARYTPFLLGLWGCSRASAADGSGTATHGRLVASTSTSTSATATPAPGTDATDVAWHHQPPQAAFDACKSLSEGAACSVSFNGHSHTGTCRKGPNDADALACAPAHAPEPPASDANQTLTDSALEHQLDQLEREIRGS